MSERIDEDVPGDPGDPAGPDAAGQEGAGQDGAGIPDGFARLWMPHRMAYIKGEGKPAGGDEGDGCPFCRIPGLDDAEGLIVARGRLVYSVLNLYPYNAGHLMVVPYRHVADYTDLAADETAELA
ncbi:MAG: HIT family hydrolase, partial [Streptosporangiales bacterium]